MSAQPIGSGLCVDLDPKATGWRADYEMTATAIGQRRVATVWRVGEDCSAQYLYRGTELHAHRAEALAEACDALAALTATPAKETGR